MQSPASEYVSAKMAQWLMQLRVLFLSSQSHPARALLLLATSSALTRILSTLSKHSLLPQAAKAARWTAPPRAQLVGPASASESDGSSLPSRLTQSVPPRGLKQSDTNCPRARRFSMRTNFSRPPSRRGLYPEVPPLPRVPRYFFRILPRDCRFLDFRRSMAPRDAMVEGDVV